MVYIMGYKFAQLTAPGNSEAIDVKGFLSHSWQYTISNINTNAVVRVEGSIDGTNYYNLDQDGDTTKTANGTYGFKLSDTPLFKVRFVFVSESGGTDAVIDSYYEGH